MIKPRTAHRLLSGILCMLVSSIIAIYGDPVSADTPNAKVNEMAAAIARTIGAFSPKAMKTTATSHENVVDVHQTFPDLTAFKSHLDTAKRGLAGYFCDQARRPYIDQGIVIVEHFSNAEDSDHVDIQIDKSTCAGLQPVAVADPATLAGLAASIADADRKTIRQHPDKPGIYLYDAAASANMVDEKLSVSSADLAAKIDRVQITGFLRGYTCGKYGDQIRRGVSVRYRFILPDNSTAFEYVVDKPAC